VAFAVATLTLAATALAGGPLGGGPAGGLYYYLGTAPLPAGGVAQRTSVCSEPNTRVIGGAFDTDTGSQTGVLMRSQPFDADDSDDKPDDGWWTWAQSRRLGDGTLASYAICSFDTIKYRSQTRQLEADATGTRKTSCPDGTRVTSGGVETPNDSSVEVSASYPIDDGDAGKKPDDGWAARTWNFQANTAFVTVHAVCVVGARMQYTSSDLAIGTNTTFEVYSFPCSDDAFLTGSGARPLAPLTIEGSGITAAVPADLAVMSDPDSVPDDRVIFQARNDDAGGDIRYFTACIRRG
jgi:hypothetical protein